jgi:hypothetical protein
LPAQLRNLFLETTTVEPGGNARSQRRASGPLAPYRVAKDLADLFLRAASVPASPALKLVVDVVVELAKCWSARSRMPL